LGYIYPIYPPPVATPLLCFRANVLVGDVSLSSVGRLFRITAADTGTGTGADDCSCSLYRQFRGVVRAQKTSTGCYRDQDAVVCQVPREKTAKAHGDDHGNLELYSLPARESMKVACSPISDSQLG